MFTCARWFVLFACSLAAFACEVDRHALPGNAGVGGGIDSGHGGASATGGSGGMSGQDAGGVGGSSGSSADGATRDANASDAATDAARDAAVNDAQVDAGPLPLGVATPNSLICGGVDCAIDTFPTTICCVGAVPFPTGCFPSFPGCVNAVTAIITCDDAADCDNGDACCGTMNGQILSTSCESTSCAQFQICRTTAECAVGDCRASNEAPEYGRCYF